MTSIGSRARSVTIHAPNEASVDDVGGFTRQMCPSRKVWASLETLVGRELELARQTVPQATHRIIFPFTDGVDSDCEVHVDGRVIKLESVVDKDWRRTHLVCLGIERRPDPCLVS